MTGEKNGHFLYPATKLRNLETYSEITGKLEESRDGPGSLGRFDSMDVLRRNCWTVSEGVNDIEVEEDCLTR